MKKITYNKAWARTMFNLLPHINSIAVDADGLVYGYSDEFLERDFEEWLHEGEQVIEFGPAEPTVNWETSQYTRNPINLAKIYPKDTLVYVWDNNACGKKQLRYSAGTVDPLGRLECYMFGCTSRTADGVASWENVEPADYKVKG